MRDDTFESPIEAASTAPNTVVNGTMLPLLGFDPHVHRLFILSCICRPIRDPGNLLEAERERADLFNGSLE